MSIKCLQNRLELMLFVKWKFKYLSWLMCASYGNEAGEFPQARLNQEKRKQR